MGVSDYTDNIEMGIVEALCRDGRAEWESLRSSTTSDGGARALFGTAMDRLEEAGRVRSVDCRRGHMHGSGCLFEAVAQ
jgi:hypothetical protein